ncbi:SepM family pheromone-processing serine protease [Secundilactobacillus folii]|uniref:endopeptidase La n=1 Tax=Secundilactobacillus folii TaxID=2678357 RepID=A0A7X2XUJ5_9LACO|nr:SepM family pheromone-processing serine protease [Secundilactobacillus folii]MTV81355.1 PDZ domain-containing protein [Secundilactobacillus folii]
MQKQTRKKVFQYGLSIIVMVLILVGCFWPMSQYIESPGSADNLKSFVSIKHHPDKRSGEFMITSVKLAQARPITYLMAKVLPYNSIESNQSITGGQNNTTYIKMQDFYMQSAINEAKAVAVKAAHKPVIKKYLGIYVMEIQANSHFKHKLKVGDTITKVDGHHFQNAYGFQKYIARKKVGSALHVQYQRGKSVKTVKAPLIKLSNGRTGIGIGLTDNVKIKTTPKINVDPGQIGGPSGGLMFSLQIYSQLTGQNIRHGRKIAGTGTINPDGSVGEIGGIDKKVVAAKKAGATVFFAPYIKPTKTVLQLEEGHVTNYQLAKKTAKKVAPKMKVVPVTSFNQALHYLKTHQ